MDQSTKNVLKRDIKFAITQKEVPTQNLTMAIEDASQKVELPVAVEEYRWRATGKAATQSKESQRGFIIKDPADKYDKKLQELLRKGQTKKLLSTQQHGWKAKYSGLDTTVSAASLERCLIEDF